MDECSPHLATFKKAPSPPPRPSSPSPQPPASPPPPARPQRRAATRALISLSKGYIPLLLDSSSSDTDPGAGDEKPANDNESGAAAKRKGSVNRRTSGVELNQMIEQLSGHNTGAGFGTSAGIADSDGDNDGDSDGYVAGREARRGAKRKHRRSAGARRKMMRLDRDDWKVISGAKDKKGDGKAKKRKTTSALEDTLTREEMGSLLEFVSAELDWEKVAVALGGGEEEEDVVLEREVKGESEENGMGESPTAGKDEDATRAKSAEGLKRCWNTDLSTQLLRIYK